MKEWNRATAFIQAHGIAQCITNELMWYEKKNKHWCCVLLFSERLENVIGSSDTACLRFRHVIVFIVSGRCEKHEFVALEKGCVKFRISAETEVGLPFSRAAAANFGSLIFLRFPLFSFLKSLSDRKLGFLRVPFSWNVFRTNQPRFLRVSFTRYVYRTHQHHQP